MQSLYIILMTFLWMKTNIAISKDDQDKDKNSPQEISLSDDDETEESFIEFLIMNSDQIQKTWANTNNLLTDPKCFDSALAAYSQDTCFTVMDSICTMYKCTEQVKRKLHVGCQTLNNSFRTQSPNSLMIKLELLKKGGAHKFIDHLHNFISDSKEQFVMRTSDNVTSTPIMKPIGERNSRNVYAALRPNEPKQQIGRPAGIERTGEKDRLVSQVGKLVEKVGYLVDEVETLVSEVQHAEDTVDKTYRINIK